MYTGTRGVFGGPLQLQMMELTEEALRFDVIAKAARERKEVPLRGSLRGLAEGGVNPP
jgi:hypothetical protein